MTLRDIPIVGAYVGGGGLLLELLVQGGDAIVGILAIVLSSSDLLLPLLTTLNSLASRVAWLPEETIDQLVTIALVLVVIAYSIRLVRRFRDNNDNE